MIEYVTSLCHKICLIYYSVEATENEVLRLFWAGFEWFKWWMLGVCVWKWHCNRCYMLSVCDTYSTCVCIWCSKLYEPKGWRRWMAGKMSFYSNGSRLTRLGSMCSGGWNLQGHKVCLCLYVFVYIWGSTSMRVCVWWVESPCGLTI